MILVSFTNNPDSITLKLSGHAGAAEAGKDIVCASASILCYTVAQTALFMYEQGRLRREPYIKLDKGESVVTMRPKKDSYAEALHSFFIAEVGFSLLAQSYPQYVDVQSMLGQA